MEWMLLAHIKIEWDGEEWWLNETLAAFIW